MRTPSVSRVPVATSAPRTKSYVAPFIILAGIVIASATQTETASYMANALNFDKPYFGFFATHITFSLVFPVHLAVLSISHKSPRTRARHLLRNLRAVLADQLGTAPRWKALYRPLAKKILPLTALISIPAICWFVAMAFSPAVDITAIYATSAFHTYFFSLLLLGTRLTRTTVLAIAVAFSGVLILTLDGAGKPAKDGDERRSGTRRVIGDVIMVVGAALLGLYEVVYKMVLPESQGGVHRETVNPGVPYVPIDNDIDDEDQDIALNGRPAESHTPLLAKALSRPASPTLTGASGSTAQRIINTSIPSTPAHRDEDHVPKLPTAFHSNFLTSLIGLATLVFLWPPFPLLHWTGIEVFEVPKGGLGWGLLVVIAIGGAIYNAGLMTLIGVWGPTVASVANLLTIGLVALADAVWLGHLPDFQTTIGAALICAGFGALLWEGEEA